MLQKIRELSKNLAVYGLGDVAITIVNFLLIRFYVTYLTKADYGVLALLAAIEAPVKLFFRWGVDGAFMRFWYDCPDARARQRLASTLFFFILAVNGLLLIASIAAAPLLAERFLGSRTFTLALQLVLLNTFAIGFTFIPFHVMRMEKRTREFATLTLARSASTAGLRILLVMGLGLGVMGIVVADVVVTAVMMAVMLTWFGPLIRPVFSMHVLRESLRFGLPRVPHGFALQVMSVGDRFVMSKLGVAIGEIGAYSMGVSFGLMPKIALGAFEYAWAPFYYATAREPDAPRIFSAVTTYGVAVLALMTAGLSAIAVELLDVATGGQYVSAAGVVAWTAIGVFFYGIYLLTSIGLNITSHTKYYPVSTAIGAAINIGLNVAWIPRYGILGAAWANGAAYAVQAALACWFSQRLYPIRYEYGRLTRAVVAAILAWAAARALPEMSAFAGLIVRGLTVVVVMTSLLWITRFFNAAELRSLNALRRRVAGGRAVTPPPDTTELAGEIVSVDLPDEGVTGSLPAPSPVLADRSRAREYLPGVLVILAIGALVLRLIGVQYGLPAIYNPDEVAIMARALSFAKGTLNPHNFLYPTFFFYVLFAWVGVYLAGTWLTGRVGSIAELQRLYFSDPTGIYTAGRLLGTVSGTASVVLLYRFGARLIDARTGLAAAAFLAAAPLAVRDAHYVKHDVFATLTIVAAYLAMLRVWPAARPGGPTLRDAGIAGAACGVAFSTHYYCVFLALPLAWTILQAWRLTGAAAVARGLAVAAAMSAVVFLALSPFLAVEPATAWRDIIANRQIVIDRAVAEGAFGPVSRYLEMLWSDSTGAPVIGLAAIGAIWMLVASPARAVLLLAFPIPFFAFIANTYPASRYLNPLLPFVAMFAAWTISTAATRVGARAWMFWGAVALSASPGLLSSVRSDLFFRQTDTRTLALRYAETHLPPGATVLVQPYSVPLTPSREGLREALARNVGSADAASTKFQIQLSQDPYPSPSYRLLFLGHGGLDADKIYVDYSELGGDRGLDPLRRLGVAFVIVKRYNDSDPGTEPFLTALAREGRRIAAFSPYRTGVSEAEQARVDPFLHNTDARIDPALERPGPPLEIWEIGERR